MRAHFGGSRRVLAAVAATGLLGLTACSGGGSGAGAPASASGGGATSQGAAGGPSTAPGSSAPGSSASASSGSSGSAESSGPAQPAPRVTGKPASVTVLVSGDELPHPQLIADARRNAGGKGYDFSPMFAGVKDTVSAADVAICQMEAPLTRTDTDLSHGISINGPHEFATAIKGAGYDGCSTANNHAFDRGLAGARSTREIMQEVGLKAAGPGPDASTPGQPVFYEAKGLKIAQLSYSWTLDNTIGNQTKLPNGAPWFGKNLYLVVGVAGIVNDAKAARAQGADLVLVSMHWGIEYTPQVSPEQRQFATGILNSGQVDYIIGNHPHEVQPCEKINGKLVNYSLGNAISSQGAGVLSLPAATQDGVLMNVTFNRDAAGNVSISEKFHPTYVDRLRGHVIQLVTPTSNPQSWQRTTSVLTANGNPCGAQAVQ
ncbi:CapA family protein [Flexivirga sp. ID2601S]|uniref:CapA family protein n=1 Tax=Flexivirga aerilata TaxID=1656889 RepID=A0A849ABH6_9MICO|nr:CapA family protein [Flexivirga aerilata]NNG37875.1 CapA family protein [Flexivirga aerilata]